MAAVAGALMILVAIGANLPGPGGKPPLAVCQAAAAALDALPGVRLRGLSRWYLTAPVPPSDQPDYVNAVVHFQGRADPASLLAALLEIEARAGRQRSEPNAARTLDLDLIDMDGLLRPAPDPVLPHPRAHQRGFVLWPLRDVAPGWVHPALHQTVDALIEMLPPQLVRAL
jgi:2-amino-4-hydroxy-6-hydroxymethyldihydropteridine diphosphokinase